VVGLVRSAESGHSGTWSILRLRHSLSTKGAGMRAPRIVVLLVAATGSLFVGVAVLPGLAASAGTTPTVQAQPSTGVADGQVITVTGSGFSANATIALIECQTGATSEAGCDLATLSSTTASSAGGFSSPYIASRYLHLSSTVDCAISGACSLAAANYNNYNEAASTSLSFNPKAPSPPALALSGSLAKTGTVDRRTGVATLSGTVTCNRPVMASVYGELSQTYHRFIFTSYFSLSVLCTSSNRWSVAVQPTNGLFGRGKASVVGNLSGSVGGTSSQANLSGTVTLSFPKR
jgi:Neocarzinostatin family